MRRGDIEKQGGSNPVTSPKNYPEIDHSSNWPPEKRKTLILWDLRTRLPKATPSILTRLRPSFSRRDILMNHLSDVITTTTFRQHLTSNQGKGKGPSNLGISYPPLRIRIPNSLICRSESSNLHPTCSFCFHTLPPNDRLGPRLFRLRLRILTSIFSRKNFFSTHVDLFWLECRKILGRKNPYLSF